MAAHYSVSPALWQERGLVEIQFSMVASCQCQRDTFLPGGRQLCRFVDPHFLRHILGLRRAFHEPLWMFGVGPTSGFVVVGAVLRVSSGSRATVLLIKLFFLPLCFLLLFSLWLLYDFSHYKRQGEPMENLRRLRGSAGGIALIAVLCSAAFAVGSSRTEKLAAVDLGQYADIFENEV
ncbi:MAG: hypothetical protein LBN38_00090, partial [Verrucomicrobiota bacterium]|nr:hypothetical protein [Verrucomicrobiota bacterium]